MRKNLIHIITNKYGAGSDFGVFKFFYIYLGILGYFYIFVRVLYEGGIKDELKRCI